LLQVNEQFTTYTAADVAEGLQDFLICIEMFLAALAHAYAFPPRVRLQHRATMRPAAQYELFNAICY
jgi:hypothetical protein